MCVRVCIRGAPLLLMLLPLLVRGRRAVFTFSGDVCVCVWVINEDEFDVMHVRRLTIRLLGCKDKWRDGRV